MDLGDIGKDVAGKINPADVQKFLAGIKYPVTKQELIDTAKREGADLVMTRILGRIPDKEYGSPADVSREVGAASA